MIQAYRRGLLRPTLPFGRRSRLRETILLESIDTEQQARSEDRSIEFMTRLIASLRLNKDARSQFSRDILRAMRSNDLRRLMDYDGAIRYEYENSGLADSVIYDVMQEAGWLGTSAGK